MRFRYSDFKLKMLCLEGSGLRVRQTRALCKLKWGKVWD